MSIRFGVSFALGLLLSADQATAQTAIYRSPYRVQFPIAEQELLGDLAAGRGDPKASAEIPFAQWYAPATKSRYGTWGPSPVHYPAPQLKRYEADFLRQRVLATAAKFIGYGYQHHHLPDWDPPADWPWKEVQSGKNGKGVDCSNFTAFVYNLALGVKPSSETREQATMTTVAGPGPDRTSPVRRIDLPDDRSQLSAVLKPADLVFIRGDDTETVTHVVLWVGPYGVTADGGTSPSPLIIDSHGDGAKDDAGNEIPSGVYLRPVRPRFWYFRRASHALRVIPE